MRPSFRARAPSRRRLAAALILGGTLLAAGCASGRGGAADGAEESHREPTRLEVTNHNWSDVVVFVVRPGIRPVRMGMVTSMTTASFTVPGDLVGTGRDIRLIADPMGALDTYTSEPIQVFPGDRIEWRLENRLNHSALSVF